ncbi:MAG: flagellar biosynthesis protein FliQ [Granulosicoccus sp.]
MTSDNVIQIGQEALTVTVMLAAPLLAAALIVGLLVGLFQAATQINEQTLSFIPKLLAMVVALMITGPWILSTMLGYTRELIVNVIPRVVGS